MSTVPVYPVRVEGSLDAHLSRWLWLVKWVLVIPHLFVLAFMWVAFVVLSVCAFFAIAFTGRYPRAIFDFNVGVLRWTWRVGFYSYSALATDHYPPFSLREEPSYPATLEISYPDHLSRGLVWVKSWLLAIPHYLIVGFFMGAGWLVTERGGGGGLIIALVLIAGVALLFTQRYPRGIFDFVLGLNRWALRVAAYSALMTDAYPPFRLDLGGPDPATFPVKSEPQSETRPHSGGVHVVGAVFASIACLIGFTLAIGGIGAVAIDRTQRDADGYLMTPGDHFTTASYAITTDAVDVPVNGPDRVLRDLIGNVRIKTDSSGPVFVGIARRSDVDEYLGSVQRQVVSDFGQSGDSVTRGFEAPATRPAAQRFWSAQSSGSGHQTLDWKVQSGHWVAVVMNASGRRGVDTDIRIGGEVQDLGWIGGGVLAAGLLILGVGGFGLWLAVRRG
jgi:hypothetical protein